MNEKDELFERFDFSLTMFRYLMILLSIVNSMNE